MAGVGLEAVRTNVTTSVQRMTGPQRMTLGFAFFATMIAMFLLTRVTGEAPMGTLYADLEPAAAGEVVNQLEAQGVPYELTNGGATIQVPADRVHALRLELSSQGLPDGGEGWSILDDQGITTSEFDQRVGYQRAMEGELARTIAAIDGVADANVHLVIPEDDLFVGDDVAASASVLLITDGASEIGPMQVEAVVNLVSSSVEGMTPDRVSVTDEAGRLLAAPGGSGGITGIEGDAQLRARIDYENEIEADLSQLLDTLVGPGMATVNVTADLDFDSISTVTEEYVPLETNDGDQRMLNETTRNEVYLDATGEDATGVLGTEVPTIDGEGNEVDPEEAAGDGQGVEYSLDERDATYAMNKTVTTAENAVGEVTSLSVAVLLPDTAVEEASLPEIESLVQAAAGVDETRGDTLAVSLLPINEQVQETIEAANAPLEASEAGFDLIGLLRTIGTVVIALVVIFFGLRSLRSGRVPAPDERPELIAGDGTDPAELEAAREAAALAEAEQAREQAEQVEQVESEVQSLIANQPDDVAGVLRSWLNEAEEVSV
jgi:flagellar M-ring protein FliF